MAIPSCSQELVSYQVALEMEATGESGTTRRKQLGFSTEYIDLLRLQTYFLKYDGGHYG